jgi:hypothetical protein
MARDFSSVLENRDLGSIPTSEPADRLTRMRSNYRSISPVYAACKRNSAPLTRCSCTNQRTARHPRDMPEPSRLSCDLSAAIGTNRSHVLDAHCCTSPFVLKAGYNRIVPTLHLADTLSQWK